MNPQTLPTAKEAATLFVQNKQGVVLPIFDDAFGSCAKVLRKMSLAKDGSELWIEYMGQKFDAAWVEANFRSDPDNDTE
ncbi:hypothetical protein [Novosphingobium rosa]|jgi:hypothetical protein|uniref:hypothetical protein n=1 Tax=Novosphingobium rosa TaxID=76978 RepID=UPI00082B8CFA|nr:hypothetical protein [Novosphingobium rosa]